MSIRFVLQFLLGLLLVVAAFGMLAASLANSGFGGAALYTAVLAAILVGVGVLVALDSIVFMHSEKRHADRC